MSVPSVTQAMPPAAAARPVVRHDVRAAALLRDVILGGQDGLVNVLGLVLGMSAATGDARVVITAGLAAMFAESIAMAGVAFSASGAERDVGRELRVRMDRDRAARGGTRVEAWLAELRREGAGPATLTAVADAVAAEREALEEELAALREAAAPVRETHPVRAAAVVGLATLAGSAVPIVPYLLLPMAVAPWLAVLASGVVLVMAGFERARITGGGRLRAGAEMLAIGLVSALAGYLIGQLLRAPGA